MGFSLGKLVGDFFGGDSPDTSGINQAAVTNANISKEALDWYKQVYADGAGDRKLAADLATKVASQQLSSAQQNDALSKEYADYSRETFRPVEKALVADAQGYDTPERRQAAADAAVADVNMGVAANRAAMGRDLARSGVSPESMKMAAIEDAGNIGAAKAAAGAAHAARQEVETQGHARMVDAASLGRGLAANQATSASMALNAGNSSVNNAQVPTAVANQGAALMGQGFNTALQGNQSAGNLFGTQANVQNTTRGQNLNFISSMVNGSSNGEGQSGMMAFSDENIKSNTDTEVDPEQELKQIEGTRVMKDWSYDPSKGGPDDGGAKHTGPMAQEVKAKMGASAAPGGKVIDLVTMNGKLMAGMQALSERQKKTDKQVSKLVAKMGG